ncbi:putative baseplate assembly protein [Ammoniphilus resinae]|uniref:Baseplate assembly protein n=1 Tax=Ammoniphilus resinae TaxID=861532 RepID=A0ABS4GQU6_9BACL|nr:putative baseplate assembly protein [Ammoniphilus resinae]MBP1932260.1 hypothetical protein [Ammoniphilus resinae]
MLPLPNLDDRTFEQLVREARDLIPGIFTEWTDENAHDPGITLLEMLAWHIEMQQFQLDQLTSDHERKFLKLLGESPRDRIPAATSVSFSNAERPILIPYGTLLHVEELPFETVRSVTVLPDTTKRVFVHTAENSREISDDFESGSAPFYPFGEQGKVGSSMEITLEQPLPEGMPLSLWIELAAQEPTIRIPARYKEFTPSGKVVWSYWQQEGERGSWRPVDLERDESYGFHQSGPILFQIPSSTGRVHRLKAQLVEGGYNDAPCVRRLIWNEVFAKQGQTLCLSECFDRPEGEHEEVEFPLAHSLFQKGEISVQFKHPSGGWVDIDEELYTVTQFEGKAKLVFQKDTELPSGKECIRAIAVSKEISGRTFCGRGTGISGQTCPILFQPMLPDQLQLQVGWIVEGENTTVWYDWQRVLDFDESHPDSFHYVIDAEEGVIRFSDGVNGAVPPSTPFANIRMIGFRLGTGEAGNVNKGTIRKIEVAEPLQVTNLFPAYGGSEPESMKQAMERTKLRILEPNCGVTAEDLERRVMEIPGLRIARVKAIPGYKTTIHNYPTERALGHTSIVIVPYSKQQPLPQPTEGMMQTVRRHLEPYRLLTTRLHIIPPEYVRVTVRAIIRVDPRYGGREMNVKQVLNEWLQPYGIDSSFEGWEFGRPIYKSDMYEVIARVPGVQYIQDLWLMADGKDVYREEGGDIHIPPNGLAISGEHEIEFITN